MSYTNWQEKPKPDPNKRFVIMLLIAAAALVMLFICMVAGGLAYYRFSERGVTPVAAGELAVPTLPVTATAIPAAVAEDGPVPTATSNNATPLAIAPTVTLAASATDARSTPTPASVPDATSQQVAVQVQAPFEIDGSLSDGWDAIPAFPSPFSVFTWAEWDGSDDVTANWRVAWDAANLYVSVIVDDNIVAQTQSGNQTFRGDSVEIQIDTDRAGDFGAGLNQDDFQIVLSPGDFASLPPSAWRFQAARDAAGHSIRTTSARTTTGYVIEAAIPWRDINTVPAVGVELGIAFSVNDNDSPGIARQEVLKSHISTRSFDNPATWGALVLQ